MSEKAHAQATVAATPSQPLRKAEPAAPPKAPAPSLKAKASAKSVETKKATAEKSVIEKKSEKSAVQPQQERKNQKELLALLEKTVKQSKEKSGISTDGESKSITLKSESINFTTNFEEELVLYLQQQLTMPYPGKVSLDLTLNFEGKLLELQIKECKESDNRVYLEKRLKALLYPSFLAYFPKEKSRRFTLTLYIE